MLIIASMYVDYLQPTFSLRVCLHGGGGPQIGEVTYGGSPHLTCKRDQSKTRQALGVFTWRLGTLGGLGNSLRSGNPLVLLSYLNLILFT